MPRGREPFFETPEEMQVAIDAYLTAPDCDFTITGLALSLGFCSRQSFYDYEKRPDYSYTIKKARLHIERSYERDLRSKDAGGAIFALKNMGWRDKHEVDQTVKHEPIQLIFPDDAAPMESDQNG